MDFLTRIWDKLTSAGKSESIQYDEVYEGKYTYKDELVDNTFELVTEFLEYEGEQDLDEKKKEVIKELTDHCDWWQKVYKKNKQEDLAKELKCRMHRFIELMDWME